MSKMVNMYFTKVHLFYLDLYWLLCIWDGTFLTFYFTEVYRPELKTCQQEVFRQLIM